MLTASSRPQALRALTVPRGGNDDENDEPYDDVDDEPDDDDDDEARAAKAAQRWTRRAFEAAQRGRPRAAAHAFEKALELTPDDAPYRAALLINAGSYLAFSGRSADALGPLKEAARLAPDDASALHALGTPCTSATRRATRWRSTRELCTPRRRPTFPPNAPLLNNVATILLARGERSLARGALEKSLEIEPHAPGTLFNLATARYSDALETRSRKRTTSQASRIVVEASFSPGKADDDNDDGGALDDVLRLLDAAEPHAPPGSPLRERVLALRACAANRVPGRAALAAADLRDVLEHGAEHARDARRRGAALLELSRALQDDAAARRDALAEAVAVLDAAALAAPDGRDEYSPLEARGDAPRALRARARLELGLSPACDDAAGAFGHLEAAAALGAGGARHARRAGARLAARDARAADAILASLAANDARARRRRACARRARGGRAGGFGEREEESEDNDVSW